MFTYSTNNYSNSATWWKKFVNIKHLWIKSPSTTTSVCEQYRALAKKARSSPRVLSIKLQKPSVEGQGQESLPDQAQWGDIIFNSMPAALILRISEVLTLRLEASSTVKSC